MEMYNINNLKKYMVDNMRLSYMEEQFSIMI